MGASNPGEGLAPARFEFFRTTNVAYQVAYTRSEVIDFLAAAGVAARANLTGLPDEELLQMVVGAANDHANVYDVSTTLANDSDDSRETVETGQWSANLLDDNEVAAHR
jgi:hypothetical protein